MMLSQHKLAGVSTLLAICLRNGDSALAIQKKLEAAISGAYTPHSGWTDREFDIAFLVKALGGARLLYVLQKAEGYPSNTTVKKRRLIPEILVSAGIPSKTEIDQNISSFLGNRGRFPPSLKDLLRGQCIMIDGLSLEEMCRFDPVRGIIVGICREHYNKAPNTIINSVDDIDKIANALYNNQVCHHGKDGTVLAIAPVTGLDNYFPVPLILSPSCKAEKGEQLAEWVSLFIECYRMHPDGEKRHGPITVLATDGESSFRTLRFIIGLVQPLDPDSSLGRVLYRLPGLNCMTGKNGLLTTCDPKHIIKQFATMIRSPVGIQIGDTVIHSEDCFLTLRVVALMGEEQARTLLNPADKQNVPKAVNLIQTLLDDSGVKVTVTPGQLHRIYKVLFLAKILGFFLFPFIKVKMSLSEQIQSLSTYSHLITALYLKHRTAFMNSAIFADSQAIVKNVIITTARFQLLDPTMEYHILFEGTDRLEGVFSNVRTQDHSSNFDVIQLAHKLSTGTEINAIFKRHPDLNRGHQRQNLVDAHGVDHINPKSWVGNVVVGDVDIESCYIKGRDQCNSLLVDHFGPGAYIEWDSIFYDRTCDHLRPDGSYVGSRAADQDAQDDEDTDELIGGLTDLANLQDTNAHDPTNFADMRDQPYNERAEPALDQEGPGANDPNDDHEFVPEILNPSVPTRLHSPYLKVGNKDRHIDAIVAERLTSDRARKSTTRTLRARGVTVDETIRRRTQHLNSESTLASNTPMAKSGDLGGFLVRISASIVLAVGEVLNFRQGTSRTNLMSVSIADIETKSGPKQTSIAVQVLDLTIQPSAHFGNLTNLNWYWSTNFVQVQASREGVSNTAHYTLRIPGHNFALLGSTIAIDHNGKSVWSLLDKDLRSAMNFLWNNLNPDGDEIINNLQVSNPPVQPRKLDSKDIIPCKICKEPRKLSAMRNHVGRHILQSLRTRHVELYALGSEKGDELFYSEVSNITQSFESDLSDI